MAEKDFVMAWLLACAASGGKLQCDMGETRARIAFAKSVYRLLQEEYDEVNS